MTSGGMAAFRLDGRRAIVTGGGTGIGRGIAEAFVAAGARVVVCGRRPGPLEETARALGAAALAVPADVTAPGDRRRLLREADRALGGLDVLVNCAGAVVRAPLEELDEEAWLGQLRVNLLGAVALAREALPRLRARRGAIISVSTGASLRPVPGYAAYGASKAALNYASQVLALEAAPEVRVNVICPGGVDTPIFASFVPPEGIAEVLEGFRERTPLGRVGRPSDVAAAAVYLASAAAEWVTGAVLVVDGGLNLG